MIAIACVGGEASAQDVLRARLMKAEVAAKAEHGAPIQAIEDDSGNLARVFGALDELVAGKAGRLKVRIAVYGDSNHIGDHASGSLRSTLGAIFGYGGHGYVAGARPWLWYQHTEVNLDQTRGGWKAYATSSPRHKKPQYGHGGIVGVGTRKGGAVEFSSQDKGDGANQVFSQVEVFYVCEPRGGRFEIIVDGESKQSVSTHCERQELGIARVRVPQGRHKVRVEVERPRVKILGAVFENDNPGVVVDGLGVGALNLPFIEAMEERLFIDAMRARDYDLVILHTGSNMWAPRLHPGYMDRVLKRIRRALGPDVSILILSPPDFTRERRGPNVGHKRMLRCRNEKRALAREHKAAFWDFYEEMGGRGSIIKWSRQGMVRRDMVHFVPPFYDLMMRRLTRALGAEMLSRDSPAPTEPLRPPAPEDPPPAQPPAPDER